MLKSAFGKNLPENTMLLGPYLQLEIKESILRFSEDSLGKDFQDNGFYLLKSEKMSHSLAFRSGEPGEYDVHEGPCLALHVFSFLGYKEITIIDGVKTAEPESKPLIITDHINLTGINPLDYWMQVQEATPFFLDVKDLYIKPSSTSFKSGTHLSICDEIEGDIEQDLKISKAICYGKSFCPEAILASYLGMRVLAIGIGDTAIEGTVKNPGTLLSSLPEN